MSDKLNYTDALSFLEDQTNPSPQTPEEDVKQSYDQNFEDFTTSENTSYFDKLGATQQPGIDMDRQNRIIQGIGAQQQMTEEYAALDQERGFDQRLGDFDRFTVSATEKIRRGVKAGWGDYLVGTGESINYLKALFHPGDPTPDSSIGEYFKKIGEQYRNDNVISLSKDFDEMSFNNLFKAEFYTSKASRLLPYMLSFIVPYSVGASVGRGIGKSLLGRFGKAALRTSRVGGGRVTTNLQAGKGLGKLVYDGGKAGVGLTKTGKNISSYFGGGITANMVEGAHLAGESYNELINAVDENGNKLFSPKEAANQAAKVQARNLLWAVGDIVSYGILFGGLGKSFNIRNTMGNVGLQNVSFKDGVGPMTRSLIRRIAPTVGVASGYAAFEGTLEGFQETYQEWAKHVTEKKALGEDHESFTDWMKTAPTSQASKEMKDIFWSSFGMGAIFGGARGFYDAEAERTYMLNGRIDEINEDVKIFNQAYDFQTGHAEAQNRVMARHIFNYYGDGSGLKSHIQRQYDQQGMTEETKDQLFKVIDSMEEIYEKHNVNSTLTEAGAEQAFRKEIDLVTINQQIEKEKEIMKAKKEKEAQNYTDEEAKQESLKLLQEEENAILEPLLQDKQRVEQELEALYKARIDKRRKTKKGKPDKRFKDPGVVLSDEQFEEFTQEGEKRKETRLQQEEDLKSPERKAAERKAQRGPTLVERVKQGVTGAADKIKQRAGEVTGAVQRVRERRKTITEVDKIDNIVPGAKDKLKAAVREGQLTSEEISNIKGTGKNGRITNKDVNNILQKKSQEDVKKKEQTEITEQDLATQDSDPVKRETYETTNDDGNKVIIEITTAKNGKRTVRYKDSEGTTYQTSTFAEDNDISNEKIIELNVAGEEAAINKVKTEEGFENIANRKAVERRRKEQKDKKKAPKKSGEVTDDVFNRFVDTGEVSTDVVNNIAEKIKNNQQLSPQEESIRQAYSEDVEAILKQEQTKRQARVVPKTKQYQDVESKGSRDIPNAKIEKGRGLVYYTIVTDNETISYVDQAGLSDKFVEGDENVTVNLEVKNPQEGQENVVEVNGNLFFQFGNQLYESEIIVSINGEQVGKVAQRDFGKRLKRKAKKSNPKDLSETISNAINNRKKTKYDKAVPVDVVAAEDPDGSNIFVVRDRSIAYEYALIQKIIDQKFPGYQGYVTTQQLIDSYGQKSVALAFGTSVIIDINTAMQNDIIHEAGHVYYGLLKDTPLMKRIKKLLVKSNIYKTTKVFYPELVALNIDGKKITVGEFFAEEKFKNKVGDDNVISNLIQSITEAEQKNDNETLNRLFIELRTQLKVLGYKELPAIQQEALIEESFTRALEMYSLGTTDSVIQGTKAQELIKKDLAQFYKQVKGLATDTEALDLLKLSVKNIKDLDLQAAIQHVLLDFKSNDRTIPSMQNPARQSMKKAANARLKKVSGYSAIHSRVADFIGEDLTEEEITTRIVRDIQKDFGFTDKKGDSDIYFIRDYVKAIVAQTVRKNKLKQADKRLDKALAQIGLPVEIDIDDVSDISDNENSVTEDEVLRERKYELPTTFSVFIRKIVTLFNNKNPNRPMDIRTLMTSLFSISKANKQEPYNFITDIRNSNIYEITSMLRVLDSVYQDTVISNAKLIELKSILDGVQFEFLTKTSLNISKTEDGIQKVFETYEATSSSIEDPALKNILENAQNNRDKKHQDIVDIFSAVVNEKDISISNKQRAKQILDIYLEGSSKKDLIDTDALVNYRIFYDNQYLLVEDIFFGTKTYTFEKNGQKRQGQKFKFDKFVVRQGKKILTQTSAFKPTGFFKYKVKGKNQGQREIRNILRQGLILSRQKNYITGVNNVEKERVNIINKQNSLHSKSANVAELISSNYNFPSSNILAPQNNIYTSQIQDKINRGEIYTEDGNLIENAFGLEIETGLMRYDLGKEAVAFEDLSLSINNLTAEELLVSDFFKFIGPYNKNINNKEFYYSQPIVVFSDKSRRYYVKSLAAHNTETKNKILQKLKNNPVIKNKAKYLGKKDKPGNIILDIDIVQDANNNLSIKNMPQLIKDFKTVIDQNSDLIIKNKDYRNIENINKALEAFLTSYIANKFMAQQFFVHDHRQSTDQIDYVKRAAGAIAPKVIFDSNIGVEPIIFKDLYVTDEGVISTNDENAFIENDAMGFMLPEQIEAVTSKFGDAQKVGSFLKFVYHDTDIVTGETVYLKFAVAPLLPRMEQASPELKKIGDVLRERHREISENTIQDFDGKNIFKHGNLVIAVSESSAKLFKDNVSGPVGSQYVYDITEDNDVIMNKQDELYFVDGYNPLSGNGLGIQLELDKQTNERYIPSQLHYHLVTNINNTEEQELVNRLLTIRTEVMEINNDLRNKNLIKSKDLKSKPESGTDTYFINKKLIEEEKKSFRSSMSSEIYGPLLDSVYDNLDPRYPYLNQSYNAIALGRVAHKGTKLYTKGSIAYQTTSLGLNLQAYKKLDDYFDENNNFIGSNFSSEQTKSDFEAAILDLRDTKPNIVISEAWVPEYMKQQGVEIGDLFIGTRIPAHGKVSSAVFIVKEFHNKLGNTPTSLITIPAKVSAYWGADLDGDAVQMNFKYTDLETRGKNNEWKTLSNEYIDSYIDLVSLDSKQKEREANIEFEKAVDAIIKRDDQISQFLPQGDLKMFKENVPAKKLVGIVASLQGTYNIFSNNNELLPFNNYNRKTKTFTENGITINGVNRKRFFDDPNLENGIGNWYGVAQLLNIVLDNAKYQSAEPLGLNFQSIFSFITLRRLGYSLKDVSDIFNAPIVKKYMNYKKTKRKNYISRDSDIAMMFGDEFDMNLKDFVEFLQNEKLVKNIGVKVEGAAQYNFKNFKRIQERIKNGISINTSDLYKNKRVANVDVILMLYTLDVFNRDIVKPFAKAFTVHQTIEKNPAKLQEIYDNIIRISEGSKIDREIFKLETYKRTREEIELSERGIDSTEQKSGGFLDINYKMSGSQNSPIVRHALNLFKDQLDRSAITDIRYTQFMQVIYNSELFKKLKFSTNVTQIELANRIISDSLINNMSLITRNVDRETLIQDFEKLKQDNETNIFLNEILEVVTNKKGDKFITLNSQQVNNLISPAKINDIKKSFGKLKLNEKNLILELEAEFNQFGFSGFPKTVSFVPFFDNNYLSLINNDIDITIRKYQLVESANVNDIINKTVLQIEYEKTKGVPKNIIQQIKTSGLLDRSIKFEDDAFVGPKRKAKKIISSNTTFNRDYIGNTRKLTFNQWLGDKGIRRKSLNIKSKTYKLLKQRYATYLLDYDTVQKFEKTQIPKLKNKNIKQLTEIVNDLASLDNSASNFVIYKVSKVIGEKMFEHQASVLKKKSKQQGVDYVIPGTDGTSQKDLTNFRLWFGSNNMTSDRPEIQYLINEVRKEYAKYMQRFNLYKEELNKANKKLVNSKLKGLTILQKISTEFQLRQKYKYIYGNLLVEQDDTIRLLNEAEFIIKKDTLSQEEIEYYNVYTKLTKTLLDAQKRNGMQSQETYVPGSRMGMLESYDKSGLFGLYNMMINTSDYDRVKVKGTDFDGKKKLKPFYEWKNEIYKGRTGDITLDTGRKINEIEKLRKKAKAFKKLNINEDNTPILLTDVEYDALVNYGAIIKRLVNDNPQGSSKLDLDIIEEYERRKGVRLDLISYDINTALLEFLRGSLFAHGDKMHDGSIEDKNKFSGMTNISILTNAAIAFNKNLDNKNAVRYLTEWWQEGFLGRNKQESVVGKTGDKVIDGFVKLTSLKLLGFNMSVGVGNLLAGKYQELRKRGGAQFARGEIRYWKDYGKSLQILKDYRVIEHSFDDFVHLAEKKGLWGKAEKLSYIFMDKTEHYIQGASFLGFLTDEEFNNPSLLTPERVDEINSKIATLHGEGYTALDASLLSMYSFGRAILQFKKWFITLMNDRFGPEEINRFGEVNIGSYRAAGSFASDLTRKYFRGEITMQQFYEEYTKLSPARQQAILEYLRGLGITTVIIALIAILEDDEDERDSAVLRNLKRLENDIFVTTDEKRFINYTIIPSSLNTANDVVRYVGEITEEKTK